MAWSSIAKRVNISKPVRVETKTVNVDISPYTDQNEGGFAFFIATRSWYTNDNSGALYLVTGIQNGLYQNSMQLTHDAYGPIVTVTPNSRTITITFQSDLGGFYAILPIFNMYQT